MGIGRIHRVIHIHVVIAAVNRNGVRICVYFGVAGFLTIIFSGNDQSRLIFIEAMFDCGHSRVVKRSLGFIESKKKKPDSTESGFQFPVYCLSLMKSGNKRVMYAAVVVDSMVCVEDREGVEMIQTHKA